MEKLPNELVKELHSSSSILDAAYRLRLFDLLAPYANRAQGRELIDTLRNFFPRVATDELEDAFARAAKFDADVLHHFPYVDGHQFSPTDKYRPDLDAALRIAKDLNPGFSEKIDDVVNFKLQILNIRGRTFRRSPKPIPASVIEELRSLSHLDAAYRLLDFNLREADYGDRVMGRDLVDTLKTVFPDADPEEIGNAYIRAEKLEADMLRYFSYSNDYSSGLLRALNKAKAFNPGFSEKIYDLACNRLAWAMR